MAYILSGIRRIIPDVSINHGEVFLANGKASPVL
jgi:hypothetical protein